MSLSLDKKILTQILSEPTAPFREGHIASLVTKILRDNSVAHFHDPVGNVVVGAKSINEYRQKMNAHTKQVKLFIAHMDHPGFHGVQWKSPDMLKVRWLGGSPTKHLSDAKVWLADDAGYIGHGRLKNVRMHSSGKFIKDAEVDCSTILKANKALTNEIKAGSLFGGFAFRAPVWLSGNKLYTKAADDLVGVAVITNLAVALWQKQSVLRDRFIGVLTRAEEVGFIGAISHFDLGIIKPNSNNLCVSLETSRALPNAVIGNGPVVRLGDKASVFDAKSLEALTHIAKKTLKQKYQRRIMDGGTCEATVAMAYGCAAVGISVPLGNYHNQSFEGGLDSRGKLGPAPEFVNLDDIKGMLNLCKGILEEEVEWKNPWEKRKLDLQTLKKSFSSLLRIKI